MSGRRRPVTRFTAEDQALDRIGRDVSLRKKMHDFLFVFFGIFVHKTFNGQWLKFTT